MGLSKKEIRSDTGPIVFTSKQQRVKSRVTHSANQKVSF